MKHRFLAMLIVVCMLSQSIGTTAFAAEASEGLGSVSENEMLSGADSISENGDLSDADSVSENGSFSDADIVSDNMPETPVLTAEETDPLPGGEDAGGDETKNYLTSDIYHTYDVSVTPGSYSAKLSFKIEEPRNISSYNLQLIWTKDSTLGESFFPDVTQVDGDSTQDYVISSISNLDSDYIWDSNTGKNCALFSGEFYGAYEDGLEPNTTYYYRLAYQEYDSTNYKYVYHLLTVPQEFTTLEAVTESAVSVKVTEVISGYGNQKVIWTIDNPKDEYIRSSKFVYTDQDSMERTAWGYEYQDENYNIIPNTYYANISLAGTPVIGKAKAEVYTGEKVSTFQESEEVTVTPKKIEEAEINVETLKTGVASFVTQVTLNPFYEADAGNLLLRVYYRRKGEENWTQASNSGSMQESVATVTVGSLTENTEYEYYVAIRADGTDLWSNAETPNAITTKQNIVYSDEDFPDEAFRKYLKDKVGIAETDSLTSEKLEKITELSIYLDSYQYTFETTIKSLEGIQYLENLTSLNAMGQDIENADVIQNLPLLKYVYLSNNNLTVMPDFSKMSSLQNLSLNNNLIKADTVTPEKLPEGFLEKNSDWLENVKTGQRKPFSYTLAPRYYAIGETHPFLLEAQGLKYGRDYTLTVTAGDVTKTAQRTYDGIFTVEDMGLAEGTYQASITLTDQYGTVYLELKEQELVFAGDESQQKEYYIRPDTASLSMEIWVAESLQKEQIRKVELLKPDRSVAGSMDSVYVYTTSNESRYEGIFSYSNDLQRTNSRISGTVYFTRYLSAGDYGVRVTTDTESYEFSNVVHVSSQAIVEELGLDASSYDCEGDYLYVRMKGVNLDSGKIRPVFYQGDVAISQFVNAKPYSNGYIYQLKKLEIEKYWFKDQTCTYKIEADDGYEYVDLIKNHTITFMTGSDPITFEHYNYKKKAYEVFFTSAVADQTQITVSLYEDYSHRNLEATATAVVKNGMASLQFKDAEGKDYMPPRYETKYFQYTCSGATELEFAHSEYVQWYNYSSSTDSTAAVLRNNGTVQYWETGLKELEISCRVLQSETTGDTGFTAQLSNAAGTLIGEDVKLTVSKTQGDYVYLKGTWTAETGLATSVYQIHVKQGEHTFGALALYIYDNEHFYQNNQYGYWNSNDTFTVYFGSEQLMGNWIHQYNRKVSPEKALSIWKENYNLEIFDRTGSPIEGWKVDSAAYEGSTFYVHLKDLSREYLGYYFKITHKQYGPGIRLSDSKTYYSQAYNANEEYGEYESNSTGSCNTIWYTGDSFYSGVTVQTGVKLPVTVSFYQPNQTEKISSFEIAKTGSYDFKAADLAKLKSDEVYEAVITSADGGSWSSIGYFGVHGSSSGVVAATGITLNKTALNMQLGQTEALKATVKPANVTDNTVTWTSSNPAVASVDGTGKVTALTVGETDITAETHNGKTAVCSVRVSDYRLSETEFTLDIAKKETKALTVSDGINPVTDVTWSIDDDSVAAVSAAGLVTPKAAGTAVIGAAIKNGPVLTCTVTVTNAQIQAISLRDTELTLKIGETSAMKVYFTPSDTTVTKDVTWTSDAPDVASVENGVVKALAKGKAKITAAIGELSAVCTVTVLETVNEETLEIPAVSAITNVDTKLKDVELPEGWTWDYPDTALAPFAGMQWKTFAATYTKDADTEPVHTQLAVMLTTIKKASIHAESSALLAGKAMKVSLVWDVQGAQADMSDFESQTVWTSAKPAVATVEKTENGVEIKGVGKGKAKITAQTLIGGKIFKAQYTVTVAEGAVAEIHVDSVEGFTRKPDGSDYYTADLSAGTSTLKVTATNTTKLTVKNSASGVVRTGTVTSADNGKFEIPLTLQSAGIAKVTLTSDDAVKTTKDIYLYVTDAKPQLSVDALTVNTLRTTGELFEIYPNRGYITAGDAVLGGTDAAKFELTREAGSDRYSILAKEGTAVGKYQLTVTVKTEKNMTGAVEQEYQLPLKVNVVEKAPKVTVKQDGKVNLFYVKEAEACVGAMTLSSDKPIVSATLDDACDFVLDGAYADYLIIPKKDGLAVKTCKKNAVLTVNFDGYKPIQKEIKINVEKKAPKLTLSSKTSVLYPSVGLESARVQVSGLEDFANTQVSLDKADGYTVTRDVDAIVITRTDASLAKATTKLKIVLKETQWTEPVPLAYTIKVNAKIPAVKLDKKQLQLNTNPEVAAYEQAVATVVWKDATEALNPVKLSVSAANDAAQAVLNQGIVFETAGSQILARLNNQKVKAGTYKFTVNVKINDQCTLKTPLSVKVADTELKKAITVKTKGTINVLERTITSVTCSVNLKAVNGSVIAAELCGRSAHLFDASLDEDGKVRIYAKRNVALITKYKYGVKIKLTVENAEGEIFTVTTKEISLKLKQNKPKVSIAPKEGIIYIGAGNIVEIKVNAVTRNDLWTQVKSVKLLNNTDAFICTEESWYFTLESTDNAIKGKTYTLQLEIHFKDEADNEKPMVVKYKVKVK